MTDTTWATGTNWTGGTPPADDLTSDVAVFNTAFTNQPNAGTRSVAGLAVGSGATNSFTITSATSGSGLSIGSSGIDMLQHAMRAVEAGDARNVLLVAGDVFRGGDFRALVDEYNVATRDHLTPIPTGASMAKARVKTTAEAPRWSAFRPRAKAARRSVAEKIRIWTPDSWF